MNKCYCINCGTLNNKDDLKCTNCHKVLEPVDDLLKTFLKDKTKDKVKDKVIDTTRDFLINFIKTHIYGIVMSVTIIGSVVGNIISSPVPNKNIVSKRPSIISKLSYDDYDGIIKDVLTSIDLNEDISKYRYGTYYKVNNDKLDDYYGDFERDLKRVRDNNIRYYLLFNLQYYSYDMVHYWNLEDFIKEHKDEQVSNEYYELHNAMYKLAVTDESLYHVVDDVKNLYVSIMNCEDEECSPNPNSYNRVEGTNNYYHFTFVKRDGSWYFLKAAEDEVSTMPDSNFLGAVYKGKYSRFRFEDFDY